MATLVAAAEPIVSSQFKAKLAENGQSATLTHTDSAGKTRSWRVEILGGKDPIGLDQDRADTIAQLFNECKALQDPLLGKRASEGPLIINTQKSSDDSIRWQWSTKPLDGKPPAWTSFEVSAKSQDIFTKLFVNVGTHHPEASQKSAHEPSAATALPSYRTDLKGIPNLGNTCFMNAALQGLLRMPQIREYLTKDLGLAEGSDEQQLQSSLKALFDEFQKKKPDSETIRGAATTIRNLQAIKQRFKLGDQHDSSEFLACISKLLKLDSAPQYCIKAQNLAVGKRDQEPTPAPGLPRSMGTAAEACCVTLTGGRLNDFHTKLKMDSLFLQNISEHDEVDAASEDARTQQTKFTHDNLEELRHLSFLLPRFGTDAAKHQGAVTSIFSENLTVPIHQGNGTSRLLNFQAQSVICHIDGHTRHSGHYVTIVRESEGFKEISDNKSRILTLQQAEEIVSRNGYIVNYNRLVSSSEWTSI